MFYLFKHHNIADVKIKRKQVQGIKVWRLKPNLYVLLGENQRVPEKIIPRAEPFKFTNEQMVQIIERTIIEKQLLTVRELSNFGDEFKSEEMEEFVGWIIEYRGGELTYDESIKDLMIAAAEESDGVKIEMMKNRKKSTLFQTGTFYSTEEEGEALLFLQSLLASAGLKAEEAQEVKLEEYPTCKTTPNADAFVKQLLEASADDIAKKLEISNQEYSEIKQRLISYGEMMSRETEDCN